MKQAAKITMLRLFSALIVGVVSSSAFLYLFANLAPRAFESLGVFIGRLLGVGFEGAVFELLVIVSGSVAFFSIVSWWVLRSWGPLRHEVR